MPSSCHAKRTIDPYRAKKLQICFFSSQNSVPELLWSWISCFEHNGLDISCAISFRSGVHLWFWRCNLQHEVCGILRWLIHEFPHHLRVPLGSGLLVEGYYPLFVSRVLVWLLTEPSVGHDHAVWAVEPMALNLKMMLLTVFLGTFRSF